MRVRVIRSIGRSIGRSITGNFTSPVAALLLLALLLISLCGAARAEVRDVNLPMRIDYPLLAAITARAAYTGPGQTAVVVDEGQGCRKVVLSDPAYLWERDSLAFVTDVSVKLGADVWGNCLGQVEWSGKLELLQRPVLSPDWRLTFMVTGSRVLTPDGREAQAAEAVWRVIKDNVITYLTSISIDLAPPVAEVRSSLLPLFAPAARTRTKAFLESLRPGRVTAGPAGIKAELLGRAEAPRTARAESEAMLSAEELEAFTANWEAFDAFLVSVITRLSGGDLDDEDRAVLFDTLLSMRHRFMDELSWARGGPDFVRREFLDAWASLAPIFRKKAERDGEAGLMGYLSFFTACDALAAMDEIGPAMGIEISRQGLANLAGLLAGGEAPSLAYTGESRRELRQALGLGEEPSMFIFGRADPGFGERLADWLLPSARAAGKGGGEHPAVEAKWVFDKGETDLSDYMERLKGLVGDAASQEWLKAAIPDSYKELYGLMAQATAWQESCYRQFIERGGETGYLKSYNNTSVGLMQINERVWRNIYDWSKLRWDIGYNAAAGCEIMTEYFKRYALRKMGKLDKKLGEDELAGVVYAMYNGGPSQFAKYLDRSRNGKFYEADKLYREKFDWVKAGEYSKISKCLVGG